MTETRTNRFDLPQWGSGSDVGSRDDFNEAFSKLNGKSAYDDGVTLSSLPANDVAGRYALVSSGGYRTVYRSDGSVWDAVGGNTMPRAFHYRALEGQTRTATAITLSHPDATNPGATFAYDGSAVLTGTVRIHDDDEPGRGVLMVGTELAADPTVRGRAHVRTRADGEHALVVQAHGSAAGYLLAARESGGANVFTVDALGRLQQRGPSAFGGASLSTQSVTAISPTSSNSDGIGNGLLLYGQAAASAKTLLRIQLDSSDTTPIGLVSRTAISLGRLPWTSGTLTLAANTVYTRVSGDPANTDYFSIRKSDTTSLATEQDTTKDIALVGITPLGITTGLPLFASQRQRVSAPTLTLQRVTDFSASFLELARLVPGVGGVETAQTASVWASDGRLATGAWWKSTGTTRDARQSVHHLCTKVWAAPGDSPTSGTAVPPNTEFTYTFPAMTIRSATTTDLNITVLAELMLSGSSADPDNADGQVYSIRTFVAVNGGAFNEVDVQENAQAATTPDHRPTGDVLTFNHRYGGVAAGSTFQVRLRVGVGDADPTVYVRKMDLNVVEALFETYTAA